MQMKGFLPTWEVTWLESQEKEVELVEKTLQPTHKHWNLLFSLFSFFCGVT